MPKEIVKGPQTPGISLAEVREACLGLGRELDHAQARGLTAYLDLLMRWNARMNLVGARTWRTALADLVADSWRLADLLAELDLPADCLTMDLGAGAGLPGVPLRLFWDRGEYLLVELRAKRAIFLRRVLGVLDPPRTGVFEGRAEDALATRGPVDLALSRAFMPWREFLALVEGRVTRYALVMANDPFPRPEDAPPGWESVLCRAYPSGAGQRYFWVFSPARAPRKESLSSSLVATSSACSPNSMSRSRKSRSS